MARDPFESLPEDLPIDVMPASNEEFYPERPTDEQIRIMRLADEVTETARRKVGMSRRDFVRTAAAMAIGVWSIDKVTGGTWGNYAIAGPLGDDPTAADMCSMNYPNAQLANLAGEFILDLQSHHVMTDGFWRVAQPVHWAVIALLFGAASNRGGELDPTENTGRAHYFKELFLDSSTTATVLSPVPSSPDLISPLPTYEAVQTAALVKELSGTDRTVVHAYVMPNRGGTKQTGAAPLFLQEELDAMMEKGLAYKDVLRGFKVYSPYGDVPFASGFLHDDDIGLALCEQVLAVSAATDGLVPPTLASHKGPQLPGFDENSNSCQDVGGAARQYPGVNFIIYHSGAGGGTSAPYPGNDAVVPNEISVNSLIRSLRVNGMDAESHILTGLEHGNSPNVYAEIGSTWRGVMRNANNASHLLGKLIKHVGAQRVVWGTDSLWYGSPQPEIVLLRSLVMTDAAKELYNLPYGLDGDRFDPTKNALVGSSYLSPHPAVPGWPTDGEPHPDRTIRNGIFGRNAAVPYRIDVDAVHGLIACDDVNEMRNQYYVNQYTDLERAPGRTNTIYGPRTMEELQRKKANEPWLP